MTNSPTRQADALNLRTPKQREVYDYIKVRIEVSKTIPSVQDVTDAFNYKSKRSAALLIDQLIGLGLLERATTGNRQLKLCDSHFVTHDSAPLHARIAELEAQVADKWQPIETAPKDGTEVLLYNETGTHQAWFEDGEWRVFRHHGSGGQILFWLNPRPTHWMQLPQSPNQKAPSNG